jgi:hypothetical protein
MIAMNQIPAELNFEFLVPVERMLEVARQRLNSADADERNVAKAVLDATRVTKRTQAKLMARVHCDMGEYFDHWMGDALESAERLLQSQELDVRSLATCLIDQSRAMIRSKEMFLAETKRVEAIRKKRKQ